MSEQRLRDPARLAQRLAALASPIGKMTEKRAYAFGVDCRRNGANENNCHFGIFSKPEFTRAWERGNKDGKAQKP